MSHIEVFFPVHVGEEHAEEEEETGEVKPSSSEVCDRYSEVDSALSSREDLTMGMGLLGMGSSLGEEEEEEEVDTKPSLGKPSSNAQGRRKSLRACKGKRYQEFMNTGRLVTGKRNRGTVAANEGYV